MKRSEQIKLLKGLSSGAKTVNDLVLRPPRIFTKRAENDFYLDTITQNHVFAKDSAELHKMYPRQPIIVIHITRKIITHENKNEWLG